MELVITMTVNVFVIANTPALIVPLLFVNQVVLIMVLAITIMVFVLVVLDIEELLVALLGVHMIVVVKVLVQEVFAIVMGCGMVLTVILNTLITLKLLY